MGEEHKKEVDREHKREISAIEFEFRGYITDSTPPRHTQLDAHEIFDISLEDFESLFCEIVEFAGVSECIYSGPVECLTDGYIALGNINMRQLMLDDVMKYKEVETKEKLLIRYIISELAGISGDRVDVTVEELRKNVENLKTIARFGDKKYCAVELTEYVKEDGNLTPLAVEVVTLEDFEKYFCSKDRLLAQWNRKDNGKIRTQGFFGTVLVRLVEREDVGRSYKDALSNRLSKTGLTNWMLGHMNVKDTYEKIRILARIRHNAKEESKLYNID